jgi:hypothetical protein
MFRSAGAGPLSCLSFATFLILCACSSPSIQMHFRSNEQYVVNASSVGFEIKPFLDDDSGERWLATYSSEGKTAKFRIEFGPPKPLEDQESRMLDVHSGDGRFVAEPGSKADVILDELKKALEAKMLPARIQRVTILPFKFVRLGKNQSRNADGGFFQKPPGNWTPSKIFIGHGDQEGQVFLNINPVLKVGEFAIKDPVYGDIMLSQLARVL